METVEGTEAHETVEGVGDGLFTLASDPLVLGGGGLITLVIMALLGWQVWGRLTRGPATGIEAGFQPLALPQASTEAPEPPSVDEIEEPPPTEGLSMRLSAVLGRSRAALQERFDTLFGREKVDDALFEELEEALITADVGLPTTERLLQPLRDRAGEEPAALREALREEIRSLLTGIAAPLGPPPADPPWVILVVGVNGSGKTTTIGKLAARFTAEGKEVLLAASDTYRAAATEQLSVWAERAGADIVAHGEGADPGAVAYDALQAAKARGADVVIVDTAGRLQTRKPLMQQLAKIRRVLDKVVPGAPHETLLVVDGTMGQNALSQTRLFDEATPLTGVVVAKLDGTAKGGMILTIAAEVGLPVKLIGIGERVEDLREFEVDAFVDVLA